MSKLTTINQLLSSEECELMIERLETVGFHEQLSGDKDRVIRTRCIQEDRHFVSTIWPRVQPSIARLTQLYDESFQPEPKPSRSLVSFEPVGLNELLRCYKYRPGEQFRRHEDFAHQWSATKRTFLSVLIYLNDNFTGGATRFEEDDVQPSVGKAVIFPHELVHEGCPVTAGVKYALRSDVVFSATADSK